MKKLRHFHEGEVQLQIESGVDPVAYDAAVDQPFGAELSSGRSLQLTGRGVTESAETPDGQVQRALVIGIEEVRVSQAPVGTWTDVEAFDLARVFGPAAGA